MFLEEFILRKGEDQTQSSITCSKLTIESLEQGVKYVQSEQERHQNDADEVFYC